MRVERVAQPIPMKLIERTASAIIVPGGIQSHGIDSSTVSDCASVSMLPQLGVGGCTPRPRKLSPASSRIALAMPNVDATIAARSRSAGYDGR